MPARNGMGPGNEGPATGRGMGNCPEAADIRGSASPGFFGRRGSGRGGFNRRRRFFSENTNTSTQENQNLNNRISALESTIDDLKHIIQSIGQKG